MNRRTEKKQRMRERKGAGIGTRLLSMFLTLTLVLSMSAGGMAFAQAEASKDTPMQLDSAGAAVGVESGRASAGVEGGSGANTIAVQSALAEAAAIETDQPRIPPKEGQYVRMGDTTWRIVDAADPRSMQLLATANVAAMRYGASNNLWETSEVYRYLSGAFVEQFSQMERLILLESRIDTGYDGSETATESMRTNVYIPSKSELEGIKNRVGTDAIKSDLDYWVRTRVQNQADQGMAAKADGSGYYNMPVTLVNDRWCDVGIKPTVKANLYAADFDGSGTQSDPYTIRKVHENLLSQTDTTYLLKVTTGEELFGTRKTDTYDPGDYDLRVSIVGEEGQTSWITLNPFKGDRAPGAGEALIYKVQAENVGNIVSLKYIMGLGALAKSGKNRWNSDWHIKSIQVEKLAANGEVESAATVGSGSSAIAGTGTAAGTGTSAAAGSGTSASAGTGTSTTGGAIAGPVGILVDGLGAETTADDSATFELNRWVLDPFVNEITAATQYTITVKTGSPLGAGTDANIYVRLIGETGLMTDEVELNSLISGNAFERNDTDTVTASFNRNVGRVNEIQVRSDMKWAGADWYVDWIKVQKGSGSGSDQAVTLQVKEWIADTTTRIYTTSPAKSTQYKLTVKTGDEKGAGTDSGIYIKLMGDRGETQEREISELVSGNAFEKGSTDTLIVNFDQNVGDVKKIELHSDQQWAGADWKLETIRVEPLVNGEAMPGVQFEIHEWIHDSNTRTYSLDPVDSAQYRLTVKTGSSKNAGTDSNIYVKLVGSDGETEEREISELYNGNAFEKGSTNVLVVNFDKNIGQVQSIKVRSDMKWAAADWELASIQVEPLSGGTVQSGGKTFEINRWIRDTGWKLFTNNASECAQYRFTVKTGSDSLAGTDAMIYVKLVGSKGETEECEISELYSGNAFEKGTTHTVTATFNENIGTIQKLLVRSDMSGVGADWLADSIKVEPVFQGAVQSGGKTFYLNQWINDKGWKTFSNDPADSTQYRLTVKTGNDSLAGTDANIYVKLVGSKGETAEREISELYNGNAFEKGTTHTVTAIFDQNIGTVQKLLVRSDMSGVGPDWLADSVKVEPVFQGAVQSGGKTFYLNQWINDKGWKTFSNDPADSAQYRLTVKTGNSKNAGTDANIYVKLIGAKGETAEREISELYNGNAFEKGTTHTVTATFDRNIGTVQKIKIRNDMSGVAAGWELASVKVEPVFNNTVQSGGKTFEINTWLKDGAEKLFTGDPKESAQYRFTVKTGSATGAGTDANIFVRLTGTKGETEECEISELYDGNVFEKNTTHTMTATFDRNVGEITKLSVRSDMSGVGADWLVDNIKVEPMYNGAVQSGGKTFIINQWINDRAVKTYAGTAQDSGQYRFTVTTGNATGAGTDANIYVKLVGSKGESAEREISELYNGNAFEKGTTHTVTATFDKNIGQIQQLKLRSDRSGVGADWLVDVIKAEPVWNNKVQSGAKTFRMKEWITDQSWHTFSVDANAIVQYKMSVKTTNKWLAGTDSNIYVKLVGEKGTTNERQLNELISGNAFERGNTDTLNVTFDNAVGNLKQLQLRSDMKWGGADWHLSSIKVQPMLNGSAYGSAKTFYFNRWIDTKSWYTSNAS